MRMVFWDRWGQAISSGAHRCGLGVHYEIENDIEDFTHLLPSRGVVEVELERVVLVSWDGEDILWFR